MGLFRAVAFLLLVVALAASVPADGRQVDECAPYVADAGSCDAYLAGQRPPLLLVSFDGFRADYIDRTKEGAGSESLSPALNLLGRCGVRARSMVPVYPTVTIPNHYSMVTGLYPESHGIISNYFYDPDMQLSFSLFDANTTLPWWWIGEPIWYTAKKQGKRSAAYFWPGSYVDDEERQPTYWLPYDSSIPYADRIAQILRWLGLPVQERPHFLSLYLDEPDLAGHYNGPDSAQVDREIANGDRQLQHLLEAMRDGGMLGCVDIMIVSDHGMASSPEGQFVLRLEDYIPDLSERARVYDGVCPSIRPNADSQEEQDRIGNALQCKDRHMRVYSKWDLPRRYHYAETDRIPSIILDMAVRWRAFVDSEYVLVGEHGWDNLNDEMQASFVAQGPSFQRAMAVAPFHNIELYNLMCAMIGLDPAPNNGTWGSLSHLLVSPPSNPTVRPIGAPSVLPYPADGDTYDEHLHRRGCHLLVGTNDQAIDSGYNLTETQSNESMDLHGPWGLPRSAQPGGDDAVRVLVNRNRITGFDVAAGFPLWVSYTVNGTRQATGPPLWRLDVRLESDHRSICDRQLSDPFSDVALVALFPLAFTSQSTESDAHVDTNVVQVSPGFQSHWTRLHELVARRVADRGPVNVVVGARDEARRPSLFVVVSSCRLDVARLADCQPEDLDMQSFLLPTFTRYNGDCIDAESFLTTHVATVKDVESVTGLELFPAWSYERKAAILARTALASHLLVNPDPDPSPEPPTTEAGEATPTTWTMLSTTSSAVLPVPRASALASALVTVRLLAPF